MATATRHGATPGLVTDDVLTADMAVRKAIPEYNQIFVDCAGAIEDLRTCRLTGTRQQCAEQENNLNACRVSTVCPKQFTALVECTERHKNDAVRRVSCVTTGELTCDSQTPMHPDCVQLGQEVHACVSAFSARIYAAVQEEYFKQRR